MPPSDGPLTLPLIRSSDVEILSSLSGPYHPPLSGHSTAVRIKTLGGLGSQSGGETLSAGKPIACLAVLGCGSGNRAATRDTLVSLLWSDLEPDAAKHALRQTLWYLKKKTGQDLIHADGDTLRLADSVSIDRDDLLEAARAADHQRVVDLYTGPFIPNFAVPGGAGFEEWASLERRRLLEVFRHSASIEVPRLLAAGRGKDAIALAKRLRDQDQYDEGGWRLLLETSGAAGDALTARIEAEALDQLSSREELELEPATRAAIKNARATTHEPASSEEPGGLNAALVGREETFAALIQAWNAAREGRPQRLHITARAGIGKTRLLKDLTGRLKAMRAKVATVSGSYGMRDIEYAPVGELAVALATLPGRSGVAPASAATLVELSPALSTWFERPQRIHASADLMRTGSAALKDLISAVAFENPVAILIDDLHWWDAASLKLLEAALSQLGDARILLVTAGRPESRRLPLVGGATTSHLTLEPLSVSHVEELILSIATFPPGDGWSLTLSSDIWRATRGSPLLVLELLQHLEEREFLRHDGGTWVCRDPEALKAALQQSDVLRARLSEMERGDLWLLTLIAIGRTALAESTISAAASREPRDVNLRLGSLETRGLIQREGDGWRISHDEIADEALRAAAADAIPRATSQLGAALAATTPYSEATARRAMQLLRTEGDADLRADLFRTFARHRFALGDRRPIARLAAQLAGEGARPAEVAALVRGAPLTWRLGLVSLERRVLAVVAIAMVALFAAWGATRNPTPPPPDAVLALAIVDSSLTVRWLTADVRQNDWVPQRPLPIQPWEEQPPIQVISENAFGADYAPSSRLLVTQRAVEGDGTIDLFFSPAGGPVRQLRSPRDDGSVALSPDGRLIAFSTARWDTLYRYDIAIMGVEDSVPRPLTSGPASDGGPKWSPDGSRLVFSRANWGAKPNELCVIRIEDGQTTCQSRHAFETDTPVGWVDNDRILVAPGGGYLSGLDIIQWSTGEALRVTDAVHARASLSPDGLWVACVCRTQPGRPPQPAVFPLGAPALIRPIVAPAHAQLLGFVWRRSAHTQIAARVRIREIPGVRAAVPAQLQAAVHDQRDNVLSLHGGIRWFVSDSAAARIDSLTGIMVATGKKGFVTVIARAGTRVVDSSTIPVDTLPARRVLAESWASLDAWAAHGHPAPTVARSRGGIGEMLNNGEGSYHSGVTSFTAFPARRGLALEARVSTPVTLPQWQMIGFGLMAMDSTRLSLIRPGENVPAQLLEGSQPCAMSYPREGGGAGLRPAVTLRSADAAAQISEPTLLTGRWATILIQLLPDGRCGFAIDGKPVGILRNPGRQIPQYLRASIVGNSAGTRIAVGPLSVWEGVRTDIDWTAAPLYR